ncbi:hypothetical protein L1785_09160 [Antribacter sp. KLBMP9083]|uniref:Uncharacterized protein n=1 Tax=Antribacter soli TaxID=2910976 RepID=A0AA41QDI5_9MICO|nr:hypothetical protein [Antribacter soli]MCF4121151.1 hypothetical protein [Antribacter soli]
MTRQELLLTANPAIGDISMPTYKGKVSGYVPRTESGVFRKRQTLVWNFRLERYGPGGKPLPRVAVEMRAKYYRGGSINNGDVVEVTGRQSRNGLVTVDKAKNLTAGTVVRARRWNLSVFIVKGLGLLLILAVLAVVAAVAYTLATGDGGFSLE